MSIADDGRGGDGTPSPKMSPAGGQQPPPGPKRIFETAAAAETDGGFALELDGRRVRTPARHVLMVPSRALADAVAAEWNAQGEHVDFQAMPLTRLSNTALDNVRGREATIVEEIIGFAASDLTCYRAERPESLIAAQQNGWDPVHAWIAERFGTRPIIVAGIMHADQPASLLDALRDVLAAADPFILTATHNFTTLTGSAFLGVGLLGARFSPTDAWACAHIDEDWQAERWGHDAEAAARRRYREGEFTSAYRFLTLHNDR
ncbi:MAG: ATP12 family protein [Pseudomonadota bacterium]